MAQPRLDRIQISPYKVDRLTPERLETLAIELGYKYGSGAAMGRFLDMVSKLDPDLLAIISRKSLLIRQNEPDTNEKTDIML